MQANRKTFWILTIVLVLIGCSEKKLEFPQDHKSILFGGDVSFGENYRVAAAMLADVGYDHSVTDLQALINAHDVFIGNLESPLTSLRRSRYVRRKSYIHWSDPKGSGSAFHRHGMRIFSLANNHTMDFDGPGLKDTLEAGEIHGLTFFGAGLNKAQADTPYVQEFVTSGVTQVVAVFGLFEYRKRYDEEFNFYAREDYPGVSQLDMVRTVEEIRDFRSQNPDALIVAFPSWGKNYAWKSNQQTTQARGLIDAGVDLILGHGAHRLQEIELYKERWIVYGLGNFMFNSQGRYQKLNQPPFSLAVALDLAVDGDHKPVRRLRIYPLLTDNRVTKYKSRTVTETEMHTVHQLLVSNNVNAGSVFEEYQNDALGPHYVLEF